jgi:hypothetical protein
MECPQKIKHRITEGYRSPPVGFILKRIENRDPGTYIFMFITVYLQQPKSEFNPAVQQWEIDKQNLLYTCRGTLFSS